MEEKEEVGSKACCSNFQNQWQRLKDMQLKGPRLPKCVYVFLAILLVIQGVWIFMDASKRGLNKWLWGPIGFLSLPFGFIAYVLVTKRKFDLSCCNLSLKCCQSDDYEEFEE